MCEEYISVRQIAETAFHSMMRNATPKYVYAQMLHGLCRDAAKRLSPSLAKEELDTLAHDASLLVREFLRDTGFVQRREPQNFPRVPSDRQMRFMSQGTKDRAKAIRDTRLRKQKD